MKTFIILFCFLALAFRLQGQEYNSFPQSNAFWSAMHCEPGPAVAKSGLVKVGVFGDTLINAKTYHKLYLQRKYVNGNYSCDTCGFDFSFDSAFYFISFREENKIIYFLPQQNGFGDPEGTEYPVFNFNISDVGQTIIGYEYVFIPFGTLINPTPTPGCGSMQDTVTLTVESIDSVEMSDGSFRRRINFKPLTYGREESWIEGIGSTKGFGLALDVTNSNNTMICFSHDGVHLATADILSRQLCTTRPDSSLTFDKRCEYTSAVSVDEQPVNKKIEVFPDPVTGTFTITGLAPGDKISIYNVLGQLIYEHTSDSPELLIDNSGFDSGIYIFTVNSQNKSVIWGKFVKSIE
jgi:hypothetical protein